MKNHPITLNGIEFKEMLVAENRRDMHQGLNALKKLSCNAGFLYVLDQPKSTNHFQNSNPNFAIDSVTFDKDGIVVDIRTLPPNTKASGEMSVECLYAVDLPANTATKIGLKVGKSAGLDLTSLEIYRNSYNNTSAYCPSNQDLPDGWLDLIRHQIGKFDSERDDLFDLNLQLAGAKYDLKAIRRRGWLQCLENKSLEGIWLERIFQTNSTQYLFRIYCSTLGHLRHLDAFTLDAKYGFHEKSPQRLPYSIRRKILEQFNGARIGNAAADLEDELSRVIWKHNLSALPQENSIDYNQYLAWIYEFKQWTQRDPYTGNRLLVGLLQTDFCCEYEDILEMILEIALELDNPHGLTRFIKRILEKKTIQTASLWNNIGCALDRLNLKEAALFCFIHSWRMKYNSKVGKNIWLMGKPLMPVYLKSGKHSLAKLTADAMVASVQAHPDPTDFTNLLCALGMLQEVTGRFDLGCQCYLTAAEWFWQNTYPENNEDKSTLFYKHPMLFQLLFGLYDNDADIRRHQLEKQLHCYPKTPAETGDDGTVPITFIEGFGLGDLWASIAPKTTSSGMEDMFRNIIAHGTPHGTPQQLPSYACGSSHIKQTTGLVYDHPDDENTSPLRCVCILGKSLDSNEMHTISAYPIFKRGHGWKIISPLNAINLWQNAVEASAEFQFCPDNSLDCYLQDYGLAANHFVANCNYVLEIAAFAYNLEIFTGKEFDITQGPMIEEERQRLQAEGKDEVVNSVKVLLPQDTTMIHRSFSGWNHDVSIIAPVEKVEHFSFLGEKLLKFTLAFDERGNFAKLPVFVAEHNLTDQKIPKVGDTVICDGWLQGMISDAVSDTSYTPDAEAAKKGHERWTYLRAPMSLDILTTLAADAIGKHGNVVRFKKALPCDPMLSCRLIDSNGKLGNQAVFVKLHIGLYDDPNACKKAIKDAKDSMPPNWFNLPTRFAAVVGIKAQPGSEGYHIHYLEFANQDGSDTMLTPLG